MPPACVYTFLFLWRDFFVIDVTLVFIRVSGETFFILKRLFLVQRDFFYSARLFFFCATFFLATESNRVPSSP